eukprot:TRINITY_DN4091_c0_g1_i1.p1 TRINITY_DN4091_c0_g1~~TRINITY_DN4091_c0_g1_i1.p1  ORF type:complete len:1166 (+),score=236.56 TRINITY_DN4091_c0_g1_i1:511-3498(+)
MTDVLEVDAVRWVAAYAYSQTKVVLCNDVPLFSCVSFPGTLAMQFGRRNFQTGTLTSDANHLYLSDQASHAITFVDLRTPNTAPVQLSHNAGNFPHILNRIVTNDRCIVAASGTGAAGLHEGYVWALCLDQNPTGTVLPLPTRYNVVASGRWGYSIAINDKYLVVSAPEFSGGVVGWILLSHLGAPLASHWKTIGFPTPAYFRVGVVVGIEKNPNASVPNAIVMADQNTVSAILVVDADTAVNINDAQTLSGSCTGNVDSVDSYERGAAIQDGVIAAVLGKRCVTMWTWAAALHADNRTGWQLHAHYNISTEGVVYEYFTTNFTDRSLALTQKALVVSGTALFDVIPRICPYDSVRNEYGAYACKPCPATWTSRLGVECYCNGTLLSNGTCVQFVGTTYNLNNCSAADIVNGVGNCTNTTNPSHPSGLVDFPVGAVVGGSVGGTVGLGGLVALGAITWWFVLKRVCRKKRAQVAAEAVPGAKKSSFSLRSDDALLAHDGTYSTDMPPLKVETNDELVMLPTLKLAMSISRGRTNDAVLWAPSDNKGAMEEVRAAGVLHLPPILPHAQLQPLTAIPKATTKPLQWNTLEPDDMISLLKTSPESVAAPAALVNAGGDERQRHWSVLDSGLHDETVAAIQQQQHSAGQPAEAAVGVALPKRHAFMEWSTLNSQHTNDTNGSGKSESGAALFPAELPGSQQPSPGPDQSAFTHIARPSWEIPYEHLEMSKFLGRGAYGDVWKGNLWGTEVACKMLLKSDKAVKDDFEAEVTTLSRMRHPNVVLFIGATLTKLCIVTEFVSRGSLFDILREDPDAITAQIAMKLIIGIAKGMNYLHQQRPPIIHRDLKTPNVLVDVNWEAKIADFGLAKIKQATFAQTMCGSPPWMAPEVVSGGGYGEAADTYSWGVMLWELATKRLPYEHLMPVQVLAAKLGALKVTPFHEDMDPATPAFIRDLIRDCTERDPAVRPSFKQILLRLDVQVSGGTSNTTSPASPMPVVGK